MKLLRIVEWIGFGLVVIGFLIDVYISDKKGTPMSFTGPDNNFIFLIGLATWAICYGARKLEERKAKGE